jgi:hypothetical protein
VIDRFSEVVGTWREAPGFRGWRLQGPVVSSPKSRSKLLVDRISHGSADPLSMWMFRSYRGAVPGTTSPLSCWPEA